MLRFLMSCAVLISIVSSSALAHDDHPPKVLDESLYRAAPMPDRIILTWKGDPAHSQAVTWRTDPSIAKGLAQIAVSEPGPSFVKNAKELVATTELHESDLGPAHYHSVEFLELAPSTKYVYRVGDGTNWSEWIQFNTASDKPEPF